VVLVKINEVVNGKNYCWWSERSNNVRHVRVIYPLPNHEVGMAGLIVFFFCRDNDTGDVVIALPEELRELDFEG
jgi:hypothetical protein